jgi:hypothetical protein
MCIIAHTKENRKHTIIPTERIKVHLQLEEPSETATHMLPASPLQTVAVLPHSGGVAGTTTANSGGAALQWWCC